MKYIIAAFSVLALSSLAHAEDPARLIEGCKELVRIYDKRGEKQALVGFTTSVSDAMRAGYCRGVIDEYRRTSWSALCRNQEWHSLAMKIASTNEKIPSLTVSKLLEGSCGR